MIRLRTNEIGLQLPGGIAFAAEKKSGVERDNHAA